MHPWIEVVYCLILNTLGGIMLRKLAIVKHRRKINYYKTFAAKKYSQLRSKKLSIRLIITTFMHAFLVTSFIQIEQGMMSVVWNY